VAAPSAEIAPPPVAGVNCAGLTVMAGLVLAVLLPSLRSVAMRVKLPFILKKTVRLVVPETRAELGGSVAVASLAPRPTASVTELIRFQKASTAVDRHPKPLLTIWALGVPVLPVAVPGAAVSPGTSSCSLVKAPGLIVTLALVAGGQAGGAGGHRSCASRLEG